METTVFGRTWLVGRSDGENWSPLPDSYLFPTEAEAIAWAKLYLAQHPLLAREEALLVPKEIEISEVVNGQIEG